jgi:hypothetical protein
MSVTDGREETPLNAEYQPAIHHPSGEATAL